MEMLVDKKKFQFRLTDAERDRVEQNIPLAVKAAKDLHRRNGMVAKMPWKDCEQSAFLCLCQAVKTHDPEKGTLGNWAWGLIQRHLLDFAAEAVYGTPVPSWYVTASKKAVDAGTVHARNIAPNATKKAKAVVENRWEDFGPEWMHPEAGGGKVTQRHYAALRAIFDSLPPRSAFIAKAHFLDGRSYHQIGRDLGISYARVQQICKRDLDRVRWKFDNCVELFPHM